MKRILILLLVLIGLAAVAWWLSSRSPSGSVDRALTDMAIEDTASVDRIFITETNGSSVDLRRGENGWTVNGIYEADPVPVRLLLKTFLRVELRSPVPKSMEENVLRLMAATGKKVEIYMGDDEPEKIWYVGHATQDHVGTFMLLEEPGKGRSDVPFVMGMSGFTGYLTTRFHTKLDDWRNTGVFIQPDMHRIKEFRSMRPDSLGGSFVISQQDGRVVLRDDEGRALPMDTLATQDVLLQLKDLHFEYIERNYNKLQRDSIRATPIVADLEVIETDGGSTKVLFHQKAPYRGQADIDGTLMKELDVDRMYAVVDDSLLVVVQRILFDRILVPAEALRSDRGRGR